MCIRDRDSLDWKNYGVDSIITTVCNHKALAPGAIILCHNGAKYTADALDAMLKMCIRDSCKNNGNHWQKNLYISLYGDCAFPEKRA